jgi:hypothetical protein
MKAHPFHGPPRHDFRGEDTARFCGHISPDGDLCVEERGHPLHRYEVDPVQVMERRMLGQRRDYRDLELGNPTLKDYGV